MAKTPDTKPEPAPETQKPSAYNTPVPDGVQPTLQRFEDGKSIADVLPGPVRGILSSAGIRNVGMLRRIRNVDLHVDDVEMQAIHEVVPFECRPGEKVLVPVEAHPDQWQEAETDDRANRSR